MKISTKSKITVGITCFNAISTIERAVTSAISQDWPNLEVVIVDDFSTDGSWDVIKSLVKKNHLIKALRHSSNRGAAESRNSLLKNSTGDFIAFFDDDDESECNRVLKQYLSLVGYEKSNGVDNVISFASGVRLYPNGYEFKMPAIGSKDEVPHGPMVADYLLCNTRHRGFFYGAGTPTCAMMARRSTLLSVGGFDKNLRRVEDIDICIRLALNESYFVGCPEILFKQYSTVSNYKSAKNNFKSELFMINKYKNYLVNKNLYRYSLDWFYIRYLHFDKKHLLFVLNLIKFVIHNPIRGGLHMFRSLPSRWVHESRIKRIHLDK
jgi:glycosyltransferase involved in cell wall biosynthesis